MGDLVDGENTPILYPQNTVNILGLEGKMTYFCPITSSTCTWSIFLQDFANKAFMTHFTHKEQGLLDLTHGVYVSCHIMPHQAMSPTTSPIHATSKEAISLVHQGITWIKGTNLDETMSCTCLIKSLTGGPTPRAEQRSHRARSGVGRPPFDMWGSSPTCGNTF